MTEYIPVSQELDALAINPEIKVTKQGKELHFENVSLHFSPLSSRTALVQFENQIESGAYVLGDGFQMLCQTAGKLDGFIDIAAAQITTVVIEYILKMLRAVSTIIWLLSSLLAFTYMVLPHAMLRRLF